MRNVWERRAARFRIKKAPGLLAGLAVGIAVLGTPVAEANWGSAGCGYKAEPTNEHCYGLAERDIERFGGVLASIDFVDTTPVVYNGIQTPDAPAPGDISEEEWISWPTKANEWIETGQTNGETRHGYFCCEERGFYAKQYKGHYSEEDSTYSFPLNNYNHYVLFDPEKNGVWRTYWGCCEVAKWGGGWPAYLMQQEAGIEAATYEQPYNWGRQEVAASDGGEWTPWSGASKVRTAYEKENYGDICIATNVESSAAGNIMWSTQPGC